MPRISIMETRPQQDFAQKRALNNFGSDAADFRWPGGGEISWECANKWFYPATIRREGGEDVSWFCYGVSAVVGFWVETRF
jgi:hypothetical protein